MSGNRLPSAFRRSVHVGALMASVSAVVIAGSIFTSSDALARKKPPPQSPGFFSFFDSAPPPSRPYRVYNQRRPDRSTEEPAKTAKTPEAPVKGPLVISVSLAKQRLTVYDIDGPIAEAPISSGQPAFPTFTGVFTILEK